MLKRITASTTAMGDGSKVQTALFSFFLLTAIVLAAVNIFFGVWTFAVLFTTIAVFDVVVLKSNIEKRKVLDAQGTYDARGKIFDFIYFSVTGALHLLIGTAFLVDGNWIIGVIFFLVGASQFWALNTVVTQRKQLKKEALTSV